MQALACRSTLSRFFNVYPLELKTSPWEESSPMMVTATDAAVARIRGVS